MVPDDNMRHDVDTRLLPGNDIGISALDNTKAILLKTKSGVLLKAKDARRAFAIPQAAAEAAAVRAAAGVLGFELPN